MQLPNTYNYIGIFLTMRCCYSCSYCINWKTKYEEANSKYWIDSLSRLETKLSVTIGGGEPSLHEEFYEIINGIPQNIDLLTNLCLDIDEFIDKVPLDKFDNNKTFAPIRVSFHSNIMDINTTLFNIRKLTKRGYRVGLYCIDCEDNKKAIKVLSKEADIDFQLKKLLPNSVIESEEYSKAICRTRELLVAPDGRVFKCHRDLYKKKNTLGHIDRIDSIDYEFRDCYNADECHPCDTKIKLDRYGRKNYVAIDRIKKQ